MLKYHPDKNPKGLDRYKEIQAAYQVLSNPQQRKLYDTYGERGTQPRAQQKQQNSQFGQQNLNKTTKERSKNVGKWTRTFQMTHLLQKRQII